MFGCVIAEGLFVKQHLLPAGQSLARQLRGCKSWSSELFSISRKLPELNCRHNYWATILGPRGCRASEPCAVQLIASSHSRAVKIQIRSFSDAKPYDINTNIKKDVILYKYENPKYFRRLNIFGFSQLIFWTYLAQFVFTQLKNVPVNETQIDDLPWWRRINLGEKTHRIILTSIVFIVGYAMFSLAWVHTLKSVRYLILRKGGKDVTLVTYTPFGENRMRTISLDKITSKQSREAAKVQLPIKVKGDWMHYLLDMQGEFRHPTLFDFTAGLKRQI